MCTALLIWLTGTVIVYFWAFEEIEHHGDRFWSISGAVLWPIWFIAAVLVATLWVLSLAWNAVKR